MPDASEQRGSFLLQFSNAMVALHKEQFGRGASVARSHFAGPDTIICVLTDVLLTAERRMLQTGHREKAADTRVTLQEITRAEFIAAAERVVGRKVIAFGSCVDVDANVAFENFVFAPSDADGNND